MFLETPKVHEFSHNVTIHKISLKIKYGNDCDLKLRKIKILLQTYHNNRFFLDHVLCCLLVCFLRLKIQIVADMVRRLLFDQRLFSRIKMSVELKALKKRGAPENDNGEIGPLLIKEYFLETVLKELAGSVND